MIVINALIMAHIMTVFLETAMNGVNVAYANGAISQVVDIRCLLDVFLLGRNM